jgi:threo-3-hydroxy-L-aspartate ammonia-lyase
VITLEDVLAAGERLAGMVHRTPVLTTRTLDELTEAAVLLKAENLQRAGSFKIRGAFNRISQLTPPELQRGVVAYSSGNHAQAVGLAARLVGTRATILAPADAPQEKLAATRDYGAEVLSYDRYRDDREAMGRALAEERGLTLVPPFDDPDVIAGQGTAALELIEDAGPLDVLLAPVGGGGLIAGSATAAKGMSGATQVWGVEPEAGDDHRRSLEAGERVVLPEIPRTIADGLQAPTPGRGPFEINRRLLSGVLTVTDEEIVVAMVFAFERLKVVLEPSGAVALAAVLAGTLDVAGRRVGVILSGGNVSPNRFAELTRSSGTATPSAPSNPP